MRSDGEPRRWHLQKTITEILLCPVVLERTPRHDSRANPAVRTLEEQVKVIRLDFEERTGTHNLAISCFWPWLIRHAGWLDSRFRMKTNGATPYQDACDSAYTSELLLFGEVVLFRIQLPHTRRTNHNRMIYRNDTGSDTGFWCGRLVEDNARIIVKETGRQIARTIRRPLPNQRTDVSLLKLVKRLSWDGQGLVVELRK